MKKRERMNEDRYGLFPINNNSDSDFDVIFIHGLGGDKYTTWQNSNNESWQQWLAEDFNASVWTIGYGANKTNWIEDDMSLEDTATFFLSTLKNQGIGDKPYMFIVHSLGGLLVKNILLKSHVQPEYQKIVENCKEIVFFGVPHTGSGWATLLKYAKPVLRNSNLLKALPRGTAYLNNLVTDFNGLVTKNKIAIYIFYETSGVHAPGLYRWLHLNLRSRIVSQESATQVHSTNQPMSLPENHISMCKIRSKTSDIYANKMKMIMNKMIEIVNSIREEKNQRKEKEASQVKQEHSGSGDNVVNKTVINKSVSVGGSSSGIIITGDNNTVS